MTLSKVVHLSEPFLSYIENEVGRLYPFWKDAKKKMEVNQMCHVTHMAMREALWKTVL